MKGSERSLGEYLEHFIRGKLAEHAFKKYLLTTYSQEVLTDVDLPVFIVGDYLPDLVAIKRNDTWDFARFWIEVKAVVKKQKWMLTPTTSVIGSKRSQPRPYCVYVECLVDLPQDHISRLLKYEPNINRKMSTEWKEKLADLSEIEVTVLGYALYNDIRDILGSEPEAVHRLNTTFGADNWRFLPKRKSFKDSETGASYGDFNRDNCVIRLSKLRQDWDILASLLKKNEPLVPIVASRNMTLFRSQIEKAIEIGSKEGVSSWFTRSLALDAPSLDQWVTGRK